MEFGDKEFLEAIGFVVREKPDSQQVTYEWIVHEAVEPLELIEEDSCCVSFLQNMEIVSTDEYRNRGISGFFTGNEQFVLTNQGYLFVERDENSKITLLDFDFDRHLLIETKNIMLMDGPICGKNVIYFWGSIGETGRQIIICTNWKLEILWSKEIDIAQSEHIEKVFLLDNDWILIELSIGRFKMIEYHQGCTINYAKLQKKIVRAVDSVGSEKWEYPVESVGETFIRSNQNEIAVFNGRWLKRLDYDGQSIGGKQYDVVFKRGVPCQSGEILAIVDSYIDVKEKMESKFYVTEGYDKILKLALESTEEEDIVIDWGEEFACRGVWQLRRGWAWVKTAVSENELHHFFSIGETLDAPKCCHEISSIAVDDPIEDEYGNILIRTLSEWRDDLKYHYTTYIISPEGEIVYKAEGVYEHKRMYEWRGLSKKDELWILSEYEPGSAWTLKRTILKNAEEE